MTAENPYDEIEKLPKKAEKGKRSVVKEVEYETVEVLEHDKAGNMIINTTSLIPVKTTCTTIPKKSE